MIHLRSARLLDVDKGELLEPGELLIDEGRPKELVDAMPHVQVALRASLLQYDAVFDELLKCQGLPFREADPAMAKAAKMAKGLVNDKDEPAIPIAIMYSSFSARGPPVLWPDIRLTVKSMSMEVSSASPVSSPSPCAAWPSPTNSKAPAWYTGR